MAEPNPFDIAAFPVDDRDRVLGAYMESWSAVEKQLLMVTWILLRSGFGEARVVFTAISGNAQLRDLLLALAEINLTEDECAEFERIMDKLKWLATKRNRIVHGEWIAHMDSQSAPTRISHWMRHYHPSSYGAFMGALTGDNQKAAANFSFTLPKIQELTSENRAFCSRLDAFKSGFSDRLQPKPQQRTYEPRRRKPGGVAPTD